MLQQVRSSRYAKYQAVFLSLLVAFVLLVLGSCTEEEELHLPETSLLIGRDSIALVTVEYARLYTDPDPTSTIGTHARFGDVLPVRQRTADGRWLVVHTAFGEGWVFHEDVSLYRSEAQARNARKQLQLREDS